MKSNIGFLFLAVLTPSMYSMEFNSEPKNIAESQTSFEQLPLEIKHQILEQLVSAGNTKEESLYNAAKNIRNYTRVNSELRQFAFDLADTNFIITQLANRYTDGDKIWAAIAFGTESAGTWLKNYMHSEEGKRKTLSPYFLEVVRKGQMDKINFLLSFVPKMLSLQTFKESIPIALENNQLMVFKKLLPLAKTDANDLKEYLSLAANKGAEKFVEELLAAGAPVTYERLRGALAGAIMSNNINILNMLLQKGGKAFINKEYVFLAPSIRSKFKLPFNGPLLMGAIIHDNPEMVKLLLEAGTDLNISIEFRPLFDPEKFSILSFTEQLNLKNKDAIIKLLKQHGAK